MSNKQESIYAASEAIQKQIVLDYGEPLNTETIRRINEELSKIYSIGFVHSTISWTEREMAFKLSKMEGGLK